MYRLYSLASQLIIFLNFLIINSSHFFFVKTSIFIYIEFLPDLSDLQLLKTKDHFLVDLYQRLSIPFLAALSESHSEQFIEIVSVVIF